MHPGLCVLVTIDRVIGLSNEMQRDCIATNHERSHYLHSADCDGKIKLKRCRREIGWIGAGTAFSEQVVQKQIGRDNVVDAHLEVIRNLRLLRQLPSGSGALAI